jgi:hypothetical protein
MFTHALSEFDVDFESCLRHVFVELLLATLRESKPLADVMS